MDLPYLFPQDVSTLLDFLVALIDNPSEDPGGMGPLLALAAFPMIQIIADAHDQKAKQKASIILAKIEPLFRTPFVTTPILPLSPLKTSTALSQILSISRSYLASPIANLESPVVHVSLLHIAARTLNFDATVRKSAVEALPTHIVAATAIHNTSMLRGLTLLQFALYLARTEPIPLLQADVLTECVPRLCGVETMDSFVVARVVKLAVTLVGDIASAWATARNEKVGANWRVCVVGVRLLTDVYLRHPLARLWLELRGIVTKWVRARRDGINGRRKVIKCKEALDMECGILVCLRDVCRARPRETGEDLVPLIVELLKGIEELYSASVVVLIETLLLCVEAGITDPRALWNVVMKGVVETVVAGGNVRNVNMLCQYFKTVAIYKEETETYAEFVKDVLFNYVMLLTNNKNPEIASIALATVAHFPTSHLLAIFPTPPRFLSLLTSQTNTITEGMQDTSSESLEETDEALLNAQTLAITSLSALGGLGHTVKSTHGVCDVLRKLVIQEIGWMRRAVFKGIAADAGGQLGKPVSARGVGGDLDVDVQKLAVSVAELSKLWTSGSGNRTGLAVACLSGLHLGNNEGPIRVQIQRTIDAALNDITFDDHIVQRFEAVPIWTRFWDVAIEKLAAEQKAISDDGLVQRCALIMREFFDILEKRVVQAKNSKESGNAIASITGLVAATSHISHPVISDISTKLVDLLICYIPTSQSVTESSLQLNNDHLSIVILALSSATRHLSTTDDERITIIVNCLVALVTQASMDASDNRDVAVGVAVVEVWDYLARRRHGNVAGLEAVVIKALERWNRNAVLRGVLVACVATGIMDTRSDVVDRCRDVMRNFVE
ncbi:hypothetical protein HK096_000860, partial [Nowakowskiella sp. JEL0078]